MQEPNRTECSYRSGDCTEKENIAEVPGENISGRI